MTKDNVWLASQPPAEGARMRLICVPYAGGGAVVYQKWAASLPGEVEVLRVQLPGREKRFGDPAITSMQELVPQLAAGLEPVMDKPFALFGHSMGGIICYELVRYLREQQRPLPVALYPSGHRAPHLPHPRDPITGLAHDEFVDELRDMGGTPDELLANTELLELVLPTVRADIRVWENYEFRPCEPLPCRIVAFGSEDDEMVPPDDMHPWKDYTSADFAVHILPGEHFFLHSHGEMLLRLLAEDLTRVLAGLP